MLVVFRRSGIGANASDRLRGIIVAAESAGGVAPPLRKRLESVSGVGGVPIKLGANGVDSALIKPSEGLGIKGRILPVACGAFGLVQSVVGGGSVSGSGGTDVEFHPRLFGLDGVVDKFHHLVDVVAAPVGLGHRTAGGLIGVVEVGVVAHGSAGEVEIVVENHAVDVVFGENILNDVGDALAHFRHTRVDDCLAVVLHNPVGMGVAVVESMVVGACRRLVTVGVQPDETFHIAFVTFIDPELEGVVGGSRTALAADIVRPGLVGRVIQGVGHGAGLEIDAVEVSALELVEEIDSLGLLGAGHGSRSAALGGPVDI